MSVKRKYKLLTDSPKKCCFSVRMLCQHLKAAFVCLLGKDAQAVASPLGPIQSSRTMFTDPEMDHTHHIYSFGWISTEPLLWKRSLGPAEQHSFSFLSFLCRSGRFSAIVDFNFIHKKSEVKNLSAQQ